MEVILLERVARLGQMGDVVRVKDGFARNFLLPRGKALRATDENRTRYETMKSELHARSEALKSDAAGVAGHGPAPCAPRSNWSRKLCMNRKTGGKPRVL